MDRNRIIVWILAIITALLAWYCFYRIFQKADSDDAEAAMIQPCNPNTLSPELKKAYYELKKASEQLGGFTVSCRDLR